MHVLSWDRRALSDNENPGHSCALSLQSGVPRNFDGLEQAQIHDFLSLQRLQLVLGLEAHGVERLGDEAVDGLVEVGGGCDEKEEEVL